MYIIFVGKWNKQTTHNDVRREPKSLYKFHGLLYLSNIIKELSMQFSIKKVGFQIFFEWVVLSMRLNRVGIAWRCCMEFCLRQWLGRWSRRNKVRRLSKQHCLNHILPFLVWDCFLVGLCCNRSFKISHLCNHDTHYLWLCTRYLDLFF